MIGLLVFDAKKSQILSGVFVAMLTMGWLSSATYGQVVPLRPTDSDWHYRYELFQLLLERRGLTVSRFVNDAILKPEKSVVVVMGDLQNISQRTWSNLRMFVARGGNLLIATDRTPRPSGLGILDVGSVNSGPTLATKAGDQYSGFDDCLRVRDIDSEHPLTQGVQEIIANRCGWITRPTSIRGSRNRWQTIASLPDSTVPRESQGAVLVSVYKELDPLAGSVILAADASLFTNSMLWHADNAQFAFNVAEWLCEGDRNMLVYLVDGAAATSYAESLANAQPRDFTKNASPTKKPAPDMKTLMQFLNLVLQRVEDSNIINEALKNQPRNVSEREYFRWVWGALAALVGLTLAGLWMRRSQAFGAFLYGRKMRSWYDIQSSAQHPFDQNSFAAECLARDFCRQWTGKDSSADWKQYLQDIELDSGPIAISKQELSAIKTIFELGVYGKKSHFTNEQLLSLGTTIRTLLLKLSNK